MRREITPEVVTCDEGGCGGPVTGLDWTHLIKSDILDNLDTFDLFTHSEQLYNTSL